MSLGASSNRNGLSAESESGRLSGRSSRNQSHVRRGEHNMTEAQIKEVTDQLRQDVIAHLWRHRWMKKVVFATIVIFAVWIFSLIASIMFLAWWINVDSGASKSFVHERVIKFETETRLAVGRDKPVYLELVVGRKIFKDPRGESGIRTPS